MVYKDLAMQTRISDSLLLFYVALATNFLVNFFPPKHLKYIQDNVFVKYLLGFITMLFSIYHVSTLTNPTEVVLIAIGLFLWFLMTTRLHPIYNVFIVVLLATSFMINMRIYHLEQSDYNQETKEHIKKLKILVMSIFGFTIIMSVLGYIYTWF